MNYWAGCEVFGQELRTGRIRYQPINAGNTPATTIANRSTSVPYGEVFSGTSPGVTRDALGCTVSRVKLTRGKANSCPMLSGLDVSRCRPHY